MPVSSTFFLRSTVLLLLVGLATLLAIVAATLWLTFETEEFSAEVYKARQVRTALVELRSLLQDAETGQRGYLLTRDESYLEPYQIARERIGSGLTRLRALLPSGEEVSEGRPLETIVTEKLAELAETIALERAGRSAEALALVGTGRGKRLMDEARARFGDHLGRVDAGLDRSMRRQETSISGLKWANLLGALVILSVVGGSAWIAATYTRDLALARAQLASANAGLERRVQQRTAALARANEEMQRFTYIVGHDLRSPLVNVMGFTSELEELGRDLFGRLAAEAGPPDSSDGREDRRLAEDFEEAVGFIRSSIAKMDGLIGAILRLSREGARNLEPERLDMGALVEEAAASIRHRLLERGGTIDLGGPFPDLTADRLAVEQVFGNLLDNAVKYADPARAPAIVVTGRETADGVEFSVADNGRGIAAADQERVFELFRRAGRQDQPGEGIGLSHVRAVVRRLGGEISLSSEPGHGTTFRVTLPREPRREDLTRHGVA